VASYATLEYATAALRRHLGDLTPDHLTTTRARLYARQRRAEGYVAGQRRKPVQNGTIAREIVTLRAALRWAVAAKWIAAAPAIEAPPAGKPRDRWLTRAEAAQLLAACQAPHVRLFVALGLYTAARAGALLGLTWERVDLAGGRIYLGDDIGNKRRAVVPIPDALRPYLLEARAGATRDAVIEHGGRAVASVKTGFNAACRRAGLVGVTPHTLRHTAATWMVAGGVPLHEVARYLGDSERTTERVYAKHSPDYLRAAARVLGGE
jgi:integrase